MKARWPRQQPQLSLDAVSAARLLRPLYPDAQVIDVAPLAGGLCNSTLRVVVADRKAPLVLRLYQREAADVRKEAAVARRLAGHVPVAGFLHSADGNPVTGHPYAILEWIEGQRLDDLLPALDDRALIGLGRCLGGVLGTVHGISFERWGFFAQELAVPEAIDLDHKGMLAFLRGCLDGEPGRSRLGPALADDVLAFYERSAALIDRWLPPPCLVHGDFNPANLLVRPAAVPGQWQLAAVLDWEFAFSGTPAFDFGNLLRPPLGQQRPFVTALAEGYRAAGHDLPADWQRIARLVDLTAWTEMLSRPRCAAAVVACAQSILRTTMAQG